MEENELLMIERLGRFPLNNYELPQDQERLWYDVWQFLSSYARSIDDGRRSRIGVAENLPESPNVEEILAVQCGDRKMFLRFACGFHPNITIYFETSAEHQYLPAPGGETMLYLVWSVNTHFEVEE